MNRHFKKILLSSNINPNNFSNFWANIVKFEKLGELSNIEIERKFINFELASHMIKVILFSDMSVYGEVQFLHNDLGQKAFEAFISGTHSFKMRSRNSINFFLSRTWPPLAVDEIYTWDLIKNFKPRINLTSTFFYF